MKGVLTMWNRKELKEKAKAAFKANYWKSVLVAIIIVALAGVGSGVSLSSGTSGAGIDLSQMSDAQMAQLAAALISVIAVIGVIAFIVKLLVINPLEVSCKRFFTENSKAPASLDELGYAFKNCFGKSVGTIFLRDLLQPCGVCCSRYRAL